MSQPRVSRRKFAVLAVALACLGGCAATGSSSPPFATVAPGGDLRSSAPQASVVGSLEAAALRAGGVAMLTPTAAFGQEENRQALARTFGAELATRRPDIPLVSLAQSLSALNRDGLSERYGRSYAGYRDTGLYDRDALRSIGEAVGARYLVQLKLQSFQQGSKNRFGWSGLSIVQTQTTSLRVFVQVWDSHDGKLVWEDAAETVRQRESLLDRRQIPLEAAVQTAAGDLIRRLPA